MSVSKPDWPYAGRYADLYDLFYADKPYADEAAFVHECIREFSSTPVRDVLELACGTGRHALELEKFGYNITATDRSSDMLQVARQRAAKRNSKIQFIAADMQQLQLEKKDWDAAVCLFDSIGYLKTNEAITAALTAIRDHLRAGGLFIFEFWHAPAMLSEYSPQRIRKWRTDQGEVVRISETKLDRDNRWATVDYTVNESADDGTSKTFHESHTNRFFSIDEIQELLSSSKFESLKFFAGFSKTEPINDQTWHIVAVAQKS